MNFHLYLMIRNLIKFRLEQYFEMDRFVYQLNGNKMQDIRRKDTESSFIKVFLYSLIQWKHMIMKFSNQQ